MKYAITCTLFLSILLFACSGSGDSASGGDSAKGESKPVAAAKKKPDGAKIYKSYCVTCHGLYGDMGASGAHDLTASTLSKEERIQVITNGRGLMTAFESLLNEEKIEAVAEYVETLRK